MMPFMEVLLLISRHILTQHLAFARFHKFYFANYCENKNFVKNQGFPVYKVLELVRI